MSAGPAGPLRLRVDTDDPTPPYEQLRRQLELAVRHGRLPEGSRLPPIRQLARDLGLAVGTVARTYRELEGAGLVAGSRGGGTRVSAGAAGDAGTLDRRRHAAVVALAQRYLDEGRLAGASDDELLTALTAAVRARAGPAG